jgi:hypothetical protein
VIIIFDGAYGLSLQQKPSGSFVKKPRPKKPKQRKSPRPAQPPCSRQPQQTVTRRSLRGLWKTIAVISVVFGLPASGFALWPRMTATTSRPFDGSNGYSESFTVTNTSFIPLRDLDIAIGFCSIETAKNDLAFINNCNDEANLPRMFVGDPNWHSPSLTRDETFTITLSDQLTTPTEKYRTTHPRVIASWKTISELKGANAVLMVQYRPWIVPCWSWVRDFVCVKRFRFVAEEQPNGQIMWRSVPLDWKPIKLE